MLIFKQTRSIDLPADSAFALAMNSQREAEKAEQQRIKNLVLNYEMGQKDDQNGVNNIDGKHVSYEAYC